MTDDPEARIKRIIKRTNHRISREFEKYLRKIFLYTECGEYQPFVSEITGSNLNEKKKMALLTPPPPPPRFWYNLLTDRSCMSGGVFVCTYILAMLRMYVMYSSKNRTPTANDPRVDEKHIPEYDTVLVY